MARVGRLALAVAVCGVGFAVCEEAARMHRNGSRSMLTKRWRESLEGSAREGIFLSDKHLKFEMNVDRPDKMEEEEDDGMMLERLDVINEQHTPSRSSSSDSDQGTSDASDEHGQGQLGEYELERERERDFIKLAAANRGDATAFQSAFKQHWGWELSDKDGQAFLENYDKEVELLMNVYQDAELALPMAMKRAIADVREKREKKERDVFVLIRRHDEILPEFKQEHTISDTILHTMRAEMRHASALKSVLKEWWGIEPSEQEALDVLRLYDDFFVWLKGEGRTFAWALADLREKLEKKNGMKQERDDAPFRFRRLIYFEILPIMHAEMGEIRALAEALKKWLSPYVVPSEQIALGVLAYIEWSKGHGVALTRALADVREKLVKNNEQYADRSMQDADRSMQIFAEQTSSDTIMRIMQAEMRDIRALKSALKELSGVELSEKEALDFFRSYDAYFEVSKNHDVALARVIAGSNMECSAEKYMNPHDFSVGDVVYIGTDRSPYLIKRVGYDLYKEELRVIRIGETDSYAAGHWVHYSRLYLLEIGDMLEVMHDVVDATQSFRTLHAGSQCRFRGYDDDGDIMLTLVPALDGCLHITLFFDDMQKLSLL